MLHIMAKKKKEKSTAAETIDWARNLLPGDDPLDSLARSIAVAGYALRSKRSRASDKCAQNKIVLKGPTGDWFDNPGSADVLGIDMPTIKVKEHTRTLKSGKTVKVRKHARKGKKFPENCPGLDL